jgi:hypothetical protein
VGSLESASSDVAVFCVEVVVCTKDVDEVVDELTAVDVVEELALELCVVVEAHADNVININTNT